MVSSLHFLDSNHQLPHRHEGLRPLLALQELGGICGCGSQERCGCLGGAEVVGR